MAGSKTVPTCPARCGYISVSNHIRTHLQSRGVDAHQLPSYATHEERLPPTRAVVLPRSGGIKDSMHAAGALPLAAGPVVVQTTVDHIAWSSQPDALIQQLECTLHVVPRYPGLLCNNSSSLRRRGVASNSCLPSCQYGKVCAWRSKSHANNVPIQRL